MNKKIFENARFCPKGDIEANWNKAVGFVPLDKEIIIYKADDTHSTARFKVGDGKTVIQDLPFSGTDIEVIEKLIDEKGELLVDYVDSAVSSLASKEWVVEALETAGIDVQQYIDSSVEGLASEKYVDNAVAAINIPEQIQADWNQNDETAKDYIKNKPIIPVIPEGLATEEYVDEKVASIEIPEITVDQAYHSFSVNAQSGVAVAEAINPIINKDSEQDSKITNIEVKISDIATEDIILSIFN